MNDTWPFAPGEPRHWRDEQELPVDEEVPASAECGACGGSGRFDSGECTNCATTGRIA